MFSEHLQGVKSLRSDIHLRTQEQPNVCVPGQAFLWSSWETYTAESHQELLFDYYFGIVPN